MWNTQQAPARLPPQAPSSLEPMMLSLEFVPGSQPELLQER
jgi:hypothetical protein